MFGFWSNNHNNMKKKKQLFQNHRQTHQIYLFVCIVLLFQCLQYKTEVQQDVRKIDKFISNLMRHMASNDQ